MPRDYAIEDIYEYNTDDLWEEYYKENPNECEMCNAIDMQPNCCQSCNAEIF